MYILIMCIWEVQTTAVYYTETYICPPRANGDKALRELVKMTSRCEKPRYCSVKLGDINHCDLWKSNPQTAPTCQQRPVESPPPQNYGVFWQYSSPAPHPRLRRTPVSGWWHRASKKENTTLNWPHHTSHSHSGVMAFHSAMMCSICPESPSALLKNTGHYHLVCCAVSYIWAISTLK